MHIKHIDYTKHGKTAEFFVPTVYFVGIDMCIPSNFILTALRHRTFPLPMIAFRHIFVCVFVYAQ